MHHDSCCYGRFNDVYDEPRDVLAASGAKVEEVPHRHHSFGRWCGAGGGRMWIEGPPDKRVNLLRTDEALQANPEVIAVPCPFCMTMLTDGIKAKDLEDRAECGCLLHVLRRQLLHQLVRVLPLRGVSGYRRGRHELHRFELAGAGTGPAAIEGRPRPTPTS